MTTSGVTEWSLTAAQICKYAAQELGVVGAGESLTSDEEADCLVRLNAMLKSWQGRVNLFREATGTLTVAATVGSGAMPAGMRDINDVRYVNDDGSQRPLQPWTRAEYMMIPDKTQAGTPTAYYYQQGTSADVMYIWPVPAEEVTLKISYGRIAETVTAASQTLDVPEEWQETVYICLAARIANMFGAARADPNTVQKIMKQADRLEGQMIDSDRPDHYRFEAYDNYA